MVSFTHHSFLWNDACSRSKSQYEITIAISKIFVHYERTIQNVRQMSKSTINIIILFLCLVFISGCKIWSHQAQSLPPIDKPSYLELKAANDDQFQIILINELPVERYVILDSTIDSLQTALDSLNPFIVSPNDSISFPIFAAVDSADYEEVVQSIDGSGYIGNPITARPDTQYRYELPVSKGRSFKILQGQEGSFSHDRLYNKYAVDFAMPVGDTVYAARNGIVGYLYEESSYGGNNEAYMPYSNSIMILHEDGTVAQYSHLKQYGALVAIGDQISVGQPIGLSGNTGYVSGDHLHFNVFQPTKTEPVSIFISFKGYENQRFEKGDRVSH